MSLQDVRVIISNSSNERKEMQARPPALHEGDFMLNWRRQIIVVILILSLLGLACNAITGGSEPTPTTSVGLVTDLPPTAVSGDPLPSLTPVPPQTLTPTSESVDPVPATADPDNNQGPLWPEPVALPVPFVDTTVSGNQQATFDTLSQARQPERDDIEIAQLYQGFSGALPEPPVIDGPLTVGTIQQLNVLNHEENTLSTINAELLVVSEHGYFWFDTGPGSFRPSQGDLADVAASFDDIYEGVVSFFGNESNPGVDGDPRIHIVNASPLALCNSAASCGLAGYFSSFDVIPVVVDAESNGREMFVMNMDNFGSAFYLNVLAHEFRHMIEDNHDRGDTDWSTEGSATFAEDLLGFQGSAHSRADLFLSNPDQQLNSWTEGFTLPYYGQGYLMNRYIFDRLGQELYKQFAVSPETGLRAVDSVAAANGLSLTGEQLWLDWLVTLAIHNRNNVPDIYRIQADGINTAAAQTVFNFPTSFQETVHQNAADYYNISGSGEVSINFNGSALVPVIDTAAASGEYMWYANRANYAHSRLTRAVDLTAVSQATLQYSVYHDIEYGYDYAYLYVSNNNGESWQPLIADNMQGLITADNPSGSALADRFYTGRSDNWVQESVDLSAYAGQNILIRFAYVTDPILTFGGLAVDNIAIPEIGFYDNAESLDGGWVSEGFDRVTAAMPQQWHLQLITQVNGSYQVTYLPITAGQPLNQTISLDASNGEAILIVAAAAPMSLELANYQLSFE